MIAALQSWTRSALDLVYPRNCQLCGRPLAEHEDGVICRGCTGQVRFIEPPFCGRCALPFDGEPEEVYRCGHCADRTFHFSQAVAACTAEGVAREVIHRFKYQRQLYFARHLEEWLIGAAWRWIDWERVELIVPVPLHPRKQRFREFNQAEVLARALGRAVNRPVAARALRRVKDTATQTRLHATERTQNLRGAFAVRCPETVAGQRVALVDDVFTTGATLDGCARVLHAAGAVDVLALTVARGI